MKDYHILTLRENLKSVQDFLDHFSILQNQKFSEIFRAYRTGPYNIFEVL